MSEATYPILEFDSSLDAVIKPSHVVERIEMPEHLVLCYFNEVVSLLVEQHAAREIASINSEMGKQPVYVIETDGRQLAVMQAGIGGPLAAGLLEEAIALGASKFVVCGGAGVLHSNIAVGHVIIPTAALRDEGTSYHYAPPSRTIQANQNAVAAIERVLVEAGVPYEKGMTWTTDAFYRETRERVARRRDEGCICVEMEAAAYFAVAQFREVILGQLLYGGDDVTGEDWNSRAWNKRDSVRERLFWLAAQACLSL